ncbi:common central domain of tyrosinase-domain-containing protein [Geopyxis carbonaria]|nr:common central domain of tyrosinase-domain-containing protein [Geopyxis carbonaria]
MKPISFATLLATALAVTTGADAAKPWGACGTGIASDGTDCPTGYSCTEINESYSECQKDTYHQLAKRQTNTYVTGPASGTNERWPVNRLAAEIPTVYNMFILGLDAVMNVAETNILSYYEMAGIHGAPYKSWGAGDANTGAQLGYCTHSSALFATWHRPYLSLLEQRINAHARNIAASFTGATAATWRNDATRVRLPYWDWSTNGGAMPAQLTQPTVTVTRPGTNGVPTQATIANPLYAYRFRSNRRTTDFRDTRIRNSAATRRQPPSDMSSNNMAAADQAVRNGYSSRRQNTYNLFGITTFNAFSNRAWTNGNSPSQFTSVESVHDEIHVVMGGRYGHMTWVEYSAFDPVFWLHHCNVDRLVAMYQAVYPNGRVTPQQRSPTYPRPTDSGNDDINTPLNPFRKANGQYFTSQDVSTASSIWGLRYAYPEVPARFSGQSASSLQTFTRGRINALYGPNSAAATRKRQVSDGSLLPNVAPAAKRREWLCHIQFDVKELTGHATQIMIFLGNYTSNPEERQFDPNFVGAAAAFTPAMNHMSKNVTSTVPLTDELEKKVQSLDDLLEVVPYLTKMLKWSVVGADGEIPLESMPSLKIGVSSAETTYTDGLPQFGKWETHYEVTQKKESGYILADDAIIGSTPAPKVLGKVADAIDALLPKKDDSKPSGTEDKEPASSTEGEPTGPTSTD